MPKPHVWSTLLPQSSAGSQPNQNDDDRNDPFRAARRMDERKALPSIFSLLGPWRNPMNTKGAVTRSVMALCVGCAMSFSACGGGTTSKSTPSAPPPRAQLPATLTSSFTLGLGADAIQREAVKDIRAVHDPNVFDPLVKATCKPPASLKGPYGHPQLRCHAVLYGRVLGVDSPVAPRRQIDSEPWVVDVTRDGRIIGVASRKLASVFVTDLQTDARFGCLPKSFTDPGNIPAGCP